MALWKSAVRFQFLGFGLEVHFHSLRMDYWWDNLELYAGNTDVLGPGEENCDLSIRTEERSRH